MKLVGRRRTLLLVIPVLWSLHPGCSLAAGETVIEPKPLSLEDVPETRDNKQETTRLTFNEQPRESQMLLQSPQTAPGNSAYDPIGRQQNLPRRDPFSKTPELIQESVQPTVRQVSPVFRPMTQQIKLPKMFLRGHMTDRNGEVVALLDIEGDEVHIVREGDTIGLHELGLDSVIRIKKISRLHLVIESGSLGQMLIVR